MPTIRGFVQEIEIGRAGLARTSVVHSDGSTHDYVISDLDADPERFNERLSKLAILRDAMDRAEPVEIEHASGEEGQRIERVTRLSRDDLRPVGEVTQVAGLVVDVAVHAATGLEGDGERHDRARVEVLTTDLAVRVCVLDLQKPERLVAVEQLEMLRDAQSRGRVVRLIVDDADEAGRIMGVSVDHAAGSFGGREARALDGFVEHLSLLRLPVAGGGGASSNFAAVRLTTAPAFSEPGNTVGRATFDPEAVDLLVPRHSLAYELLEAGLRDNVRVRVQAVLVWERSGGGEEGNLGNDVAFTDDFEPAEGGVGTSPAAIALRRASVAPSGAAADYGLALAAELLAPLASASRPVWISISRDALDEGPDAADCVTGTPSSDLAPRGLRDMRIPYAAVWEGIACFNAGVYRFQLELPSAFVLRVDGEEICLQDGEEEGVKLGHACLEGCHRVEVEIEAWTCDDEFVMDAFRLR